MQNILFIISGLVVLGSLGYVLLAPNTAQATTRRLNGFKLRHSDNAAAVVESQMRKAIAQRRPLSFSSGTAMSRSDRLQLRLDRTGKKWTLQQYLYVSGGLTFVIGALLFLRGLPWYLSLSVSAFVGLGLPHFVIGFLMKKRVNLFTAAFPNAIELIVRGLKSGLPISETLGVIAKEIPGPVGEEFKIVNEKIKIGKSMEDALQDTADRLGTPEFQFFVITLAIQRETGGNLAETLNNLADVLRKRAQMKLKIRAMSSESKASAYIVGSLPFIVFALIMGVNPEYLKGFFYEPRLMIAGMIGLTWMSIGVFIMAKMVNFEI
jgi:tight adherence protein B